MKAYLDLLKNILDNGFLKEDRTKTGTYSIFGNQIRINMDEGFPLLTTKKVHFKSIAVELFWFIKGSTNIKYLVERGVSIWNEWPYEKYSKSSSFQNETMEEFIEKIKNDDLFASKWGDLGPVYGKQWRDFNSFDQLKWVIEEIKTNPNSRRLIVSSWNPPLIKEMVLPPCHTLFQFNVIDNKLSLSLYQRSADVFLGLPFNIASYALLLLLVARETNLEAKDLIISTGDTHIYKNHLDVVEIQLKRVPRKLPKLTINSDKDIFNLDYEDLLLEDYDPYPRLKGKVAV
jgi:thymidylate synthase